MRTARSSLAEPAGWGFGASQRTAFAHVCRAAQPGSRRGRRRRPRPRLSACPPCARVRARAQVRPPSLEEVDMLKPSARLISYIYPSREKDLVAKLQEKKATVIGGCAV